MAMFLAAARQPKQMAEKIACASLRLFFIACPKTISGGPLFCRQEDPLIRYFWGSESL